MGDGPMEYEILTEDYGQGAQPVALPVSRRICNKKPDVRKPYTAYEVLTEYFGEDMALVLGNYVRNEAEKICRRKGLKGTRHARLLTYSYIFTRSRINQPLERTVVDFILKGKVEAENRYSQKFTRTLLFRVRYILNLRPCSQKCIGPMIFTENSVEEEENGAGTKDLRSAVPQSFDPLGIPTNDYLLPILYAKDYEQVAHEIIKIYYPENQKVLTCGDGFRVDGDDLAKRMGLPVLDVHFADPKMLGQIFYNPGMAEILDEKGCVTEKPVLPGTILISIDNCNTPAIRNSTICHECSHMYLDRTFFYLQMMTGCQFSAYTNRQEKTYRANKNGPIGWMELQCEKLPAYLLMESDSTTSFIESSVRYLGGSRSPEAMHKVIEALAERNRVSFSMTKYRLIELGYREAEGIRCYVDGRMIPDHGCSGRWPDGVTFTISSSDAAQLMETDARFLDLICSGLYRYVEGHFCLDREKFVRENRFGIPYLTPYARSHINECAIAFHVQGRYRKASYRNGRVQRNRIESVTSQYRPRYEFVAEPGTAQYTDENESFYTDSNLWGELLYDLPDDFHGAVNMILSKKGITKERLAEELGVEKRVAIRYVSQECPSLSHVVGICIAMKVPFFISEKLVELSGNSFQRKPLHHQYREFLFQVDSLSVERCEDILAERNLPPLFRGQARFEK